MEEKFRLEPSQIAYFLWVVFFTLLYNFGNVFYKLPAASSYLMVIIMFAYRLIIQGGYTELPFKLGSPALWYGGFFIWQCLAGLWTPASVLEIDANTTPEQTLRILTIFIAMDFYVTCRDDVYKLIKAFCIGSTIFAAWTMITSPPVTYGTLHYGYITGQQRNTTGYVLCFATILLIHLFIEYSRKHWLFFAALCFISSLLTGSRKIIFAYIVALAVVIIGQKDYKVTLKYLLILLVASAIIIPLAYKIPYIQEAFGERLLAILDDSIEDSSIMFRNAAKENAIRIFKEKPIIGNGWGAVLNSFSFNGVSIYAHNNYLEIAADFGLIGCILFFTHNFVEGFKCFFSMKKNRAFLTAAVLLTAMIVLDWGQVSYIYIYLMSIWGIVYKFVQCECFTGEE